MRLLDRYLLRELLVPLAYCLGGFLIFWVSFDLFAELSRFQELKLQAGEIIHYYSLRAPEFLVLVMPITFLLSLLYALTNHARYHELTAIRAAGVSLLRMVLPYLVVGFLVSLGIFALNELWVPRASESADELLASKLPPDGAREQGQWRNNVTFHNTRDNRIWTIGAFNIETFQMRHPQIEWRLPDESRRTLIASNGIRSDGVWVFQEVHELNYPAPSATNTNIVAIPSSTNLVAKPEFSETPEHIKSEIKVSRLTRIRAAKEAQLSLQEIVHYLHLHPDLTPRKWALLHTQMHARLAGPWTSFVVVLIAIPFGAASGRRNVFVGVASSIFICFAYFVLMRLGLALGTGGDVPPWIAAWSPNVLFAITGTLLARKMR